MTNRFASNLGLAMRAGKVLSGEAQVMGAIRGGEAKLVALANDASDNTKKTFCDKCAFYRVPLVIVPMCSSEMGETIGKPSRTSLAVTDKGLAELLLGSLKTQPEVEYIE